MLKVIFLTLLIQPNGESVMTDIDDMGYVTKQAIEQCNAKRKQKEFTYFAPEGLFAAHMCITVPE